MPPVELLVHSAVAFVSIGLLLVAVLVVFRVLVRLVLPFILWPLGLVAALCAAIWFFLRRRWLRRVVH